jgi:hypothetical protein
VPATAIALDPTDVNWIWISTDAAVYATRDGGATWQSERPNMPVIAIQDLEDNPRTGFLIVATHGRGVSGKKLERPYVSGTDYGEVRAIQRSDDIEAESLRKSHDGRIDSPQGQIAIAGDELRDPHPIARENRRCSKVSGGKISEKTHFCGPAEATLDEIRHFGDDELRNEQRPWVRFKQFQARFMIGIVFVDVRVKRPRIDDQRDRRASCRMISSIRRAVSRRPLRPAFAAISRRRGPPPM